jgi:N-acetylglucosaminyl-diphospho-decaprenol L-rhamnosyltransferase
MANVCVIIINYRTALLTIGCLRSLATEVQRNPHVRAAVVDNASNDDSIQQIRHAIETEGWRERATLCELATNRGFATGTNTVLRDALCKMQAPDFFWLLNSDTRVRPGALDALIAFMQTHPTAGIAGSRLEDAAGAVQRSAFRFPSILGELESGLRWGLASRLLARWVTAPPAPAGETRADWVAGASLFIRRAVLETIDLLDEQFFMYFEDVDLCRRVRRAGWEVWYVPASRVVHLVGQSSGVTDGRDAPLRRPGYWFDARRHYFLKHHGWAYSALADAAWLLGFGAWRARRRLQHKPDRDPPQLWHDFLRHCIWFAWWPHGAPRT